MKYFKYLLIIVPLTVLGSCSFNQGITSQMISRPVKGLPIDDIPMMGFRNPVYVFEYSDIKEGSKIVVKIFMKNFVNASYHYFAMAFVDGKLFYWGYPDEFNKNEDPLISKIGDRFCQDLIIAIKD